jgi:hypothetical protein
MADLRCEVMNREKTRSAQARGLPGDGQPQQQQRRDDEEVLLAMPKTSDGRWPA